MKEETKQILKNQASIMMTLVGILDYHKIEDLDYAIALNDRMKETRDVFALSEDKE